LLDKKVRVINPNKSLVGLRLMDGREIVVHPGSFVILDANNISYLNNMCTLFRKGVLVIEDNEINEFLGLDKTYNVTDEEIKEILGKSAKIIQAKMEALNEKHILDRFVIIAKDLDLPASKLKVIENITGINIQQLIDYDNEDKKLQKAKK
jgi:hypothetical protein